MTDPSISVPQSWDAEHMLLGICQIKLQLFLIHFFFFYPRVYPIPVVIINVLKVYAIECSTAEQIVGKIAPLESEN